MSKLTSLWFPRTTSGGVRLYSAVLLTLGAAFIHLAVAPAHLREYLPFGVFFLAVGSAQIVLAMELIARPTRKIAALMATANMAMIALWLVSRTVGLPFGPTPGAPETVGFEDIICNTLEVSQPSSSAASPSGRRDKHCAECSWSALVPCLRHCLPRYSPPPR